MRKPDREHFITKFTARDMPEAMQKHKGFNNSLKSPSPSYRPFTVFCLDSSWKSSAEVE